MTTAEEDENNLLSFGDDLICGGGDSSNSGGKKQKSATATSAAASSSSSNNNNNNNKNKQELFAYRKLKMTQDQNDKSFAKRRKQLLADLNQEEYSDLSPKGSIDEGCKGIMKILNTPSSSSSSSSGEKEASCYDFVTTSSCSGRISVFHMATSSSSSSESSSACESSTTSAAEAAAEAIEREMNQEDEDDDEVESENEKERPEKKGKKSKRGVSDVATAWVFVTHDLVEKENTVIDAITDFCKKFEIDFDEKDYYCCEQKQEQETSSSETENSKKKKLMKHELTFFIEPFVLHVSCKNTLAAQTLLAAAVQAGFRNSGAVLTGASASASSASICEPPSKITVAIRHTAALAVPLVFDQKLAVSRKYLSSLIAKGNEMMRENENRIKKLEKEVAARILSSSSSSTK